MHASYKDVLHDALVRYVQALDESNQSSSLVKLVSALEILAVGRATTAEYDLVVKRAASIFVEDERDYHRQILEHLRESRNQLVHATTDEETKTRCFQLQFYFFSMLRF